MKKMLSSIILICIMVLTLSSCNIFDTVHVKDANMLGPYWGKLKKEQKNLAQICDGKLIYGGNEYIHDDKDFLYVTMKHPYSPVADDSDLIIAWQGWWYLDPVVYFSETADNPIFIYTDYHSDHNLYLRDDYDYMTDIFVIEGTEMAISISEIISFENETFDDPVPPPASKKNTKITLISQTHSRIRIIVNLYKSSDSWYSCVGDYPFYPMELSMDIVEKLKENDIIQ